MTATSTIPFKKLPFPACGTIRANWQMPRFNNLSKPHQFRNQWLFWKTYSEEEILWERELPAKLHWRRRQLLWCILDVLRRLRNSPVVGQFICELVMLQHGWDDLMNSIYHFLSTKQGQLQAPGAKTTDDTIGPPKLQTPEYITNYAGVDSSILEALYRTPPINATACYDMGMDPLRPDIPVTRSEENESCVDWHPGPILTNPATDGEVPSYRCGVVGCRGSWWFATALESHENEIPHQMMGVDWWVTENVPPSG